MAQLSEGKELIFWERAVGFDEGLRDIVKSSNLSTITTGLAAALFGVSGPALIIYQSGQQGGWTDVQIASWIFSVYLFGALIGIFLSLRWKKPMAGAWTIPGAAMLGATIGYYPISEVVGAYLIAGVIVLLIGLSGQLSKLIRAIPTPIMLAMITGALLRFGIGIITATVSPAWAVIIPALCGYIFVAGMQHRGYLKKIPAPFIAIVVGFIFAKYTGRLNLAGVEFEFARPILWMPKFTISSVFSISVPLAIMVLFAENVQAIAVLIAQGYDRIPKNTRVPINAIAVLSGIGGIVTSFFGGHNANIAGPMTAMCSSDEADQDPEKRFAASFWCGIFFGSFGLVAPSAVAIIRALPVSLIGFIAGITMIGVLLRGFHGAFGKDANGRFQIGAFFSFMTAASGITLFKIGSPFWALVFGCIISLLTETNDWRALRTELIAAIKGENSAKI